MPTTSVEWQPDTWKSGEVNSETVWESSPVGIAPPPVIEPATLLKIVFWRLAIMFRWVDMIPLGLPVVPDE